MKYAEKEILVFKAFKKLLFSNANINKLTVAEIAKAAGIGKGTLYEYFKSKEDIIVKSIIYNIDEETNLLEKNVDLEPSFEKSFYILFENLTNNIATICPYMKLLLTNLNFEQIETQFGKEISEFNSLKENIVLILDKILLKGLNEGLIDKNHDLNYQRYVLMSACTGITNSIHMQEDINIEQFKSYAYNMLKKALS